jgi:hypothetical protein
VSRHSLTRRRPDPYLAKLGVLAVGTAVITVLAVMHSPWWWGLIGFELVMAAWWLRWHVSDMWRTQ